MTDHNEETAASVVPKWYTPVTIVALLWNLMGVAAFVQFLMMTPESMASLPPAEQQLYMSAPEWLTYAFGIAVITGSLGSLGLILKKRWSQPLLELSLLGVLAQNYHSFFGSNTFEVLGKDAMVMPITIIIVAFLLVVLGFMMKKKGVIH